MQERRRPWLAPGRKGDASATYEVEADWSAQGAWTVLAAMTKSRVHADGLLVAGGRRLGGGRVDPEGDHRIAMPS